MLAYPVAKKSSIVVIQAATRREPHTTKIRSNWATGDDDPKTSYRNDTIIPVSVCK